MILCYINWQAIPQAAWATLGVIVGACLTGLLAFLSASEQRRIEREKTFKVWLLDDALAPTMKYIMGIRRELLSQSSTKLRNLLNDNNHAFIEIDLVSYRYGADWGTRIRNVNEKIKAELHEGSVENMAVLESELAQVYNQLLAIYEWQASHLLSGHWRRRLSGYLIRRRTANS